MQLTGRRRELVMKRYLAAQLNAHEAARLIGVNVRTIPRTAPKWFIWRIRRERHLDRLDCALQDMESRDADD